MAGKRKNQNPDVARRSVLKGLGLGGVAAGLSYFGLPLSQARASAPELGIVSFPGPSISSHSKVIIKAHGLDEHNGWKLRWETRPTADAYYNDFVTGAYDSIDFGGLGVYANLYNKGVPLKVVQATVHWPSPVVVRADSGIDKVEDLAGKSIGLSRGSFVYAYVSGAFQGAGMSLEEDAEVTNVGFFQAPPRLKRGDFDAVAMLFEHAIALLLEAPGEYKILMDSSAEFARAVGIDRAYQYQAVRQDWLDANPDSFDRVAETYAQLGRVFEEKAESVVAQLAKPKEEGGANLDAEVGRIEYITGTEDGYRTEWLSKPVGTMGESLMKEMEAYKTFGLIERVPDDGIFYKKG